ncbi:AraC family transcriptional regulator [Clostridium sp. Marseille-P2415]|uniref:AraC family transcriptional regulator n=1 Tax=Clostridium sp. Marseille-P2415 TaxID=1805471 RepID=UPI0009887F94|nr:helix-turn-helix domain-containing protein [Clostridium sp. Marseille-P2415]
MSEKQTTYKNVAGFRCLRNIKRQTNDLYLVHCGIQQCPPDYTYNHKIPNEHHLHFILSGAGVLEIGGKRHILKTDDIFLIPKGHPILYHADHQNPWEYMWITFDGEMAEAYLSYTGLSAETPAIHSQIPNQLYLPMIRKILDTNQLTFANEIKRVGYLYEILSTLIEMQNSLRTSRKNQYDYSIDTYVDYALQYIKLNYDHIRVQDIADYIGINRSYLTSIFKKQLHVSPQEYLMRYRLNIAVHRLTATSQSIQEIATSIGYDNPLTFSKIFKQEYGMSPRHFREEKKKNEKTESI